MEPAKILENNKRYWNATADAWFGMTALPVYGTLFVTEEELGFFRDAAGKTLLEIGCGSGHSIRYLLDRGAREIWGLDMSEHQLENAKKYLDSFGYHPRLVCSPMEADAGLPQGYFDIVYSIYAVGWATELPTLFRRVAGYLKPGGTFLFSWRHPLNACVTVEGEEVRFAKSYFDEAWYPILCEGETMLLPNHKISTYVNALAGAGFAIEQMIEQTDSETLSKTENLDDRTRKAQRVPLSFLFKARKL